jgi:polysaccharide export outer membrane protein
LIFAALAAALFGTAVQAQSPAPPPSSETSSDYQIGPGDTLNVFVWREPDLSVNIPVRPDGMISTPLVEDIVAVGKTPTQLARDIEHVLSEYIRSPQVTIIVEQFVGTFNAQVRVLGQALNPGAVPYRDGMTLLDVITEAGGLTEFAAGNRSKLVRNADGKNNETRIRLDDLLNKGDLEENVRVQPGDVIVIPEAVF